MRPERVSDTVVLHYHLFKNAGTSLDALFRKNFGDAWVTAEFPRTPSVNAKSVREWIESSPDAICFSSHTALLPPPIIPGITVLPVIFVRHPLDRIASAYAFERQQGHPGFGSTLARHTSMAGYIETRLTLPNDRQCRNFHVERLAQMFPRDTGSELQRAVRAAEELPFVGIVEDFDNSLQRLRSLLDSSGLPGLDLQPVRKNASEGRSSSLEVRLAQLAEDLGPDLHESLLEANRDDLALYQRIVAMLAG